MFHYDFNNLGLGVQNFYYFPEKSDKVLKKVRVLYAQ